MDCFHSTGNNVICYPWLHPERASKIHDGILLIIQAGIVWKRHFTSGSRLLYKSYAEQGVSKFISLCILCQHEYSLFQRHLTFRCISPVPWIRDATCNHVISWKSAYPLRGCRRRRCCSLTLLLFPAFPFIADLDCAHGKNYGYNEKQYSSNYTSRYGFVFDPGRYRKFYFLAALVTSQWVCQDFEVVRASAD